LAFVVPRDLMVLMARLVSRVKMAPGVRLVRKEVVVRKAMVGAWVPQALLATRVLRVTAACLVLLVCKVVRVRSVSAVHEVILVPTAEPASRA